MAAVPLVIIKLTALNAIQGMYMPAVQASVPALVSQEKLIPANSITQMVNMFSNMAGMAVAGILYANFGLLPILIVAAICFAITAIMDLFIRIPYRKPDNSGKITTMVKKDLTQATKFMIKEKPIIYKISVIVFFLSLSLSSMLNVGMPVLITQNLGLGMDYVGVSSAIMMAGGLIGGIVAGSLGTRLKINKSPFLLFIAGVMTIPIGLMFLIELPIFYKYVILTAATALTLVALQMATIQMFAFIQTEVPSTLIGKVMSLIVILPFIASGLGSLIYGVAFEISYYTPWVVVFITVIITTLVAISIHPQLKRHYKS
jgi:predicted MFS family arabinose efflux permease